MSIIDKIFNSTKRFAGKIYNSGKRLAGKVVHGIHDASKFVGNAIGSGLKYARKGLDYIHKTPILRNIGNAIGRMRVPIIGGTVNDIGNSILGGAEQVRDISNSISDATGRGTSHAIKQAYTNRNAIKRRLKRI